MYKLSEAAARDIEELFAQSISNFGQTQTEVYVRALKECLDLLGQFPEMGISSEEIRPGYRRFSHQSHVIFYRPEPEFVLIVRVLHKSMDVNRQPL